MIITETIPEYLPKWFIKAMAKGNLFATVLKREKALYSIWERATDYRMAQENKEFAKNNGGINHLKNKLDKAILNWEQDL